MRSERGQAAVELVAALPVFMLVAGTLMCVLAAGKARERAAAAAQAGAMALIQGADPSAAARAVVPERDRPNARITVEGRQVTVRLAPRLPLGGLVDRLAATSTADAGPPPEAAVHGLPAEARRPGAEPSERHADTALAGLPHA